MNDRKDRLKNIVKAAKLKKSYMTSMDTAIDDPGLANSDSNRNLISAMAYTLQELSALKKFMATFNAAESAFKFTEGPISLMRTYKFYPDFNEMKSGDFSTALTYVRRVKKHVSVMEAALERGSAEKANQPQDNSLDP